jgi:hypothetical protein
MAQNIIKKFEQKQSFTVEEQNFLDDIRNNPGHEAYKDLWLAGLV